MGAQSRQPLQRARPVTPRFVHTLSGEDEIHLVAILQARVDGIIAHATGCRAAPNSFATSAAIDQTGAFGGATCITGAPCAANRSPQ